MRREASAPFAGFGEAADRVGATAKRLEKAAALGEYLAALGDDDLARAARYFAGYAFPLRDQRTTSVGGATLVAAVAAVTGADADAVRTRLVELGDLGDVAFELAADAPPRHSLADVEAALAALAETAGTKRRLELVTRLLEATPPVEAKYLVKLLAADLRIGLREGSVEDAVARLAGVPVGRVQWANMLLGDVGETAVLARHGRLGEARMRLFHPLKFMLATAAADLADVARQMPEEFVVEDKFDGIRAQAHLAPDAPGDTHAHGVVHEGVRVALFSRTLDEITRSFPDLVAPLAGLLPAGADGLLLDGEIVPMRGDRILPFQELQKRLGRKTLPDELREAVPVAFLAYDALYAGGGVLVAEPFARRREAIDALAFSSPAVQAAASARMRDVAALDEAFDAARARGNEGLMVKDPASPYRPGRRGREWLKIKRALATLDVVVTAVEVGHGKRRHLLSDYTFAVRASDEDPTLLNVGKAYSGLTDAELEELSGWFRDHTLQAFAHGRVRVVEPRVVVEVTFDRVQASKRHKSGYALRFPRIVRIRDDKPPAEIDTLETVRRLADT